MATGNRPGPDDLSLFDQLVDAPSQHHLFQALRVIEAHYSDHPRLGESRRPHQDPVRLGQEAELAFPPSTIADFKPGEGGQPDRLTNRFFGLFGPHGPLPLHMTEYVRDRRRNHRDRTLQAFGDMLIHRMMTLFYRAWASGQPAPSFDRDDDTLTAKVAAVTGLAGEAFQGRDVLPDLSQLGYASHLAQGPRNAEGLMSVLSTYFKVPVEVEEFVGSWLTLEPDDQWQLGRPTRLGQGTSIGNRVWSRSSKFRIRIGPLDQPDFERLLPGGASQARMKALVRSYAGDTLDWDVHLVLKGDQVPRAALGVNMPLGHLSWIGSRRDPDDIRPDAKDLYLYPRL